MNVPGGVQPRSWRHPLRWATLAMALAVVSWLVVAIPVVVLQYWVLPDVDRYAPEIERAQKNGIPWGQSETRGNAFGHPSHEGWLAYAPRLSLLDQGVLDKPCTSLLCVNGVKDPITPIQDYYLVLEHGSPKEARFVANGAHMGRPMDGSPDPTDGIILDWMTTKLGVRA